MRHKRTKKYRLHSAIDWIKPPVTTPPRRHVGAWRVPFAKKSPFMLKYWKERCFIQLVNPTSTMVFHFCSRQGKNSAATNVSFFHFQQRNYRFDVFVGDVAHPTDNFVQKWLHQADSWIPFFIFVLYSFITIIIRNCSRNWIFTNFCFFNWRFIKKFVVDMNVHRAKNVLYEMLTAPNDTKMTCRSELNAE